MRAQMIAVQEELDWEVYRLYGLVDEDLTYPGDDLPELALGERAFEIALARKVAAGEEETAWFTRHGSTPITEMPAHWPAAYRDLVQRRLDLIAVRPVIRLLEKPEHKRRWATEPWEKQVEQGAARLAARPAGGPAVLVRRAGPADAASPSAQLADVVARDADLVSVLELWAGRHGQSGRRSRCPAAGPTRRCRTWRRTGSRTPACASARRGSRPGPAAPRGRRRAGRRPIPVPPKYTSADFRKASYWQAPRQARRAEGAVHPLPRRRPRDRPDAAARLGRLGPRPAGPGAGHVIGEREAEGWDDERLVPLVAGLAELQPWVEQWHAEVDPTYGVNLADFCASSCATAPPRSARPSTSSTPGGPPPPPAGGGPRNCE